MKFKILGFEVEYVRYIKPGLAGVYDGTCISRKVERKGFGTMWRHDG